MVKTVTIFLCFVQLLLVHSQIKDFKCDFDGDGFSWVWEVSGETDDVECSTGSTITIVQTNRGVSETTVFEFIAIGDPGYWRSVLANGDKDMLYCEAMEEKIKRDLLDDYVTAIAIRKSRRLIMLKGTTIPKTKAKPKPKPKPKPESKPKAKPFKKKVAITPIDGGVTFKFEDHSIPLYNDQRVIIGHSIITKLSSGWLYENTMSKTKEAKATYTTHDLQRDMNNNLGRDVTIKIGSHTIQRGRYDMLTEEMLQQSKLKEKPSIFDDPGGGVTFLFYDIHGKRQHFRWTRADEGSVTIGRNTYYIRKPSPKTIRWEHGFHGSSASERIHYYTTDELGDMIEANLHKPVQIKIGTHTIQAAWGAYHDVGRGVKETPHLITETSPTEIRPIRERSAALAKPKPPPIRARSAALAKPKPKPLSKPAHKTRAPETKHKAAAVTYKECPIEFIQLPEKSRHRLNAHILESPDYEIAQIIRKAFPTQSEQPGRALYIYDYAIKDMIALKDKQYLLDYLKFVSVMDRFSDITMSLKKKYIEPAILMTIYKTYFNAIKYDIDETIETKNALKALEAAAADKFEEEQQDVKAGAWKDVKTAVYVKIREYFDTCIPLSSPHTVNPRVQKTPTAQIAKFIKIVFKVSADEKIQTIFDVLIDICEETRTCESYEFVSAVQYLKEICPVYNCDTDMMHVYRVYIDERRTATVAVNIVGKRDKEDMETAAADNFKTKETDPNKGVWEAVEYQINQLIKNDLSGRELPVKKRLGKEESYYKALINYDEYYDSVYDDVSFDSEYSNVYHGYDHSNSNNYNRGNGNSNFNVMNPTLMLTGLMFCLCFMCAALSNVISCGCCYVFWRYQTKIGDDKTENDHQYNTDNI